MAGLLGETVLARHSLKGRAYSGSGRAMLRAAPATVADVNW